MIYFDNAATTEVSEEIMESFLNSTKNFFGNSSSVHKLGFKAAEIEKKARMLIASFFKAEEDEVIFTSGASESNNLALKGVALRYKKRGKHIITSKIEHLSVLNTLKQLEEEYGFDITYLDVDERGVVSIDEIKRAIRRDTVLVSIMAVNNEVGSIQPIEEIGRLLKEYPAIYFHCDATQAIGKININYQNVDLISLSGHKIHSFKYAGALIKRKCVDLLPQICGGGHQNGYRSGTTNVPGEVALAKALRIAFENQSSNYIYVKKLNEYLRLKLKEIEGIKIHSFENVCSPFIISFSVPKKASVVSEALSNKDIYVSTKSACSSKKEAGSYVLEAMKLSKWDISNSLRISFSKKNTIKEIDDFIDNLKIILMQIK